MPDQSSAAREHELLREVNEPLEALGGRPLPARRDPEFRLVMRGYDRIEVDAFIATLRRQIDDLESTHSPQSAVRRALEKVGDEVSGILQRAHDTAAEITATSRREAENRLEQARAEATAIEARSQQRLREIDVDTDRIWAERDRIVGDARELARQLVELAEAAAERFPPEAEDVDPTHPTQVLSLTPPPVELDDAETQVLDADPDG